MRTKQKGKGVKSEKSSKVLQQSLKRKTKNCTKKKLKQNWKAEQISSTSYFEVSDVPEPEEHQHESAMVEGDIETSESRQDISDETNEPSTSGCYSTGQALSATQDTDTSQSLGKSDSEAEDLHKNLEAIILDSDDDDSLSLQSIECDASKSMENVSLLYSEDVQYSSLNFETSTSDHGDKDSQGTQIPLVQTPSKQDSVVFEQINYKEFIVHFKPHANLFFHGKVLIETIEGSVRILGWKMQAGQSGPVFAPKAFSLLSIEAGAEPCSVKLRPHESHMATCLHNLVPVSLFSSSKSDAQQLPASHIRRQAERNLDCRFITDSQQYDAKKLVYGYDMERLLDDMKHACEQNSNFRMALCGGKSVGKSTLLRVLVNTLLDSQRSANSNNKGILVIDLDPGQAEFTAPGVMSAVLVKSPLLGPGYTQHLSPDRMIYLGHVDVSRCAKDYRWAVKDIVQYCRNKFSTIPWVINTMGFTTGLGVSLLEHVLQVLESPTCAIEILGRNPHRNYPSNLWQQVQHVRHYPIYSVAEYSTRGEQLQAQWGLPPRQLREILLLSYLSPALNDTSFSLTTTVPYVIRMERLTVGVIHERVHPDHVLRALVGNLVGLCCVNSQARRNSIKPYGKPGPLVLTRPQALPCFGYGVVTGVDLPAGQVFLQTPESHEQLTKVNCLLLGAVELPQQLRTAGAKQDSAVPYTAIGCGQQTSSPARRFYRPIANLTPGK